LKITYLAHSCFLITSSDGLKIITDPYNTIGYTPVNESADIVTVSHEDWDHNNVAGVNGQPAVVRSPGITTAKGVEFKVIEAWHNSSKTMPNNIICFTVDGVNFCFLGDLGSSLSPEQISAIGSVDVLFIPVGGVFTLNAQKATDTYTALKPAVVIPMHYGSPKLVFSLDGIDDFIQGKSNVKKLNSSSLEISQAGLPTTTTIIVMDQAR
jgi:L-ascorbate metabolism protein UlaG (beta-lactamase superfamily)